MKYYLFEGRMGAKEACIIENELILEGYPPEYGIQILDFHNTP